MSDRNYRILQGSDTDRDPVRQLGNLLRAGDGHVHYLTTYCWDESSFIDPLFVSLVDGHDSSLRFYFAIQHDLRAEIQSTPSEFPLGPASMQLGQLTEFRLSLLDIVRESCHRPSRRRCAQASLPARERSRCGARGRCHGNEAAARHSTALV